MKPGRALIRVVAPLTPWKIIVGIPILFTVCSAIWVPAYYWMTGGRTLIGFHYANFAYLLAHHQYLVRPANHRGQDQTGYRC